MTAPRSYPGFWHAALLCGLFILFQSGLAMPFAVAQMVLHRPMTDHPAMVGVVNVSACILTLTVAWLIGRQPLKRTLSLRRVPWRLLGSVAVVMTGASLLLSEADNVFRFFLPMPEWIGTLMRGLFDAERNPVGTFVLLVAIAPLTEEPLCRGLILQGFLGRFSARKAVLLSALLFAALHVNPWQLVSAFATGCLLGWFFLRAGSLLPCLAGHAVYNGCVFGAAFVPCEIPGFNRGDALGPVEFQPWWLDLTGLALLVAGLSLFRHFSAGMTPAVVAEPARVPPVLPAAPAGATPPLLPPPA